MENILKKIIDKKKEKIIKYKKEININSILKNINNIKNFINFKNKLKERTE